MRWTRAHPHGGRLHKLGFSMSGQRQWPLQSWVALWHCRCRAARAAFPCGSAART